MDGQSADLHRDTPTLTVVDPRGLSVGRVAWYRHQADEVAIARAHRSVFDPAGRLTESQDPRLGESDGPANLVNIHSLSAQVLARDSVDAGWRVSLPGEAGQMLQGWDGRGTARRSEYDALLRPTAVFENEQCAERLTYGDVDSAAHNQCGQLIRHDDPAGTRLSAEFSLTGAVIEQTQHFLADLTLPDWPEPEPERDALLEPGAGATSRWRLNPLGDTLEQTDAQGNLQRFAHTIAGQLHASFLQLDGQSEQCLVSDIRYDAQGRVESETAGNGVISRASYGEKDGRLMTLKAVRGGGESLQDLTCDYDPVGNVIRIEDLAQPVRYFANQRIEPVSTYRYDTLYQLIEATGRELALVNHGPMLPDFQSPADPTQLANYTQTYHYDAGGNLQQLTHVGSQNHSRTLVTARQSNHSLLVENDQPPTEEDIAAAFDANGNLLHLYVGQTLNWDLRNQLQEVRPVVRESGEDDSERYVYDASGQRLRKVRTTQAHAVTHNAEVRYLPGLEIRTDTATGEVLHVITGQAGRNSVRVLHWQAGRPVGVDNDQFRYNLSDHLNSSTLELDKDAAIISQESYYPFGGTSWWAGRNAVEASYKTVRYSGKERDATGLYYYGMRYYAPWWQRWINPDPAMEVDGLNLFCFVSNNPLSRVDLKGNNGIPSELAHLNFVNNVRPALLQRLPSDKEKALQFLAQTWSIEGQELGETLEKIVDYVENAPLTINIKYPRVADIAGTSFRNAYYGYGPGLAEREYRDRAESEILNVSAASEEFKALFSDSHNAPGLRPSYGAVQLHEKSSLTGAAPIYGNSAFYMNSEKIKDRLTYTAYDSLQMSAYTLDGGIFEQTGTTGNLYPLVAHATPEQLPYYKGIVQGAPLKEAVANYVEWQAHGELKFAIDVESFSTTLKTGDFMYSIYSRRTNEFLKRNNITVRQ